MSTDATSEDAFLALLQATADEAAEIKASIEPDDPERKIAEHVAWEAQQLVGLRLRYGPLITPDVDPTSVSDDNLTEFGRKLRQELLECPEMPEHLRRLREIWLRCIVYVACLESAQGTEAPTA